MKVRNRSRMLGFSLLLISVFLFFPAMPLWAEKAGHDKLEVNTESNRTIEVVQNKLVTIKSKKKEERFNPQIADDGEKKEGIVELVTQDVNAPYHVLRAKNIGVTQMTLWKEVPEGEDATILETIDIIVLPDVAGLKKSLHDIFPDDDIQVTTSGSMIILKGMVSGTEKLAQAVGLAERYAPKKIVNMLQVGGIQQVMLEVRVAEMSRNLGQRLGIDFAASGGNSLGVSMVSDLIGVSGSGVSFDTVNVGQKVNAMAAFFGSGEWLGFFFDAMKEDGLLKILAEPTLIALSGQKASFLAGGEFPVPVPQSLDRTTINWKPFGVALNFTPVVLDGDRISMEVAPEVSDLDFSRAVTLLGYVIPSVNTRRMSTTVELRDGQSFAVAGLLKDYMRENITRFPILGDIPILGALFRSSEFQKYETELVIIVTPHLVKPINLDKQPLPTDSFIEPDGFEFFMLGALEGKVPSEEQEAKLSPSAEQGGGFDGDFGYIIPE